jgi:transposase
MKTALMGLGLVAVSLSTWAQTADDLPSVIRLHREHLAQERQRINASHEQQAKACWQKFAVNDCLSAVRKSQRAHLDPIHQKELELNAQERDWRTRQREERLQNKAADGARSEQ